MKWYFWILIAILVITLFVIFLAFGLKAVTFINKEKRINMTQAQLLKLSDEDLIAAVVTKIEVYHDIGTEEEKLAAMNKSKKTSYTVALFNWEVQNGGLCQYFSNYSRYTAPYLSEALKLVGAQHMETDFSAFVLKHHIDLSSLDEFRVTTVKEYTEKTKLLPFNEFDDNFVEIYDSENLESLNARYIREHISDFTDR